MRVLGKLVLVNADVHYEAAEVGQDLSVDRTTVRSILLVTVQRDVVGDAAKRLGKRFSGCHMVPGQPCYYLLERKEQVRSSSWHSAWKAGTRARKSSSVGKVTAILGCSCMGDEERVHRRWKAAQVRSSSAWASRERERGSTVIRVGLGK